MLTAANHFGHRENSGIVVDLFWNHEDRGDGFRVEVKNLREGARFVLYPTNGERGDPGLLPPVLGFDGVALRPMT